MEARGLLVCSRVTIVALFFMSFSPDSAVQAAQVYKWVDSSGVTHYDQKPPEGLSAVVQLLEIQQPSLRPTAVSNYTAIMEVAERLERSRLERKRLRLVRDKIDAASSIVGQPSSANDYTFFYDKFIVTPAHIHNPRYLPFSHRYISARSKRYHCTRSCTKHCYPRRKRSGVRAAQNVTSTRGVRRTFISR